MSIRRSVGLMLVEVIGANPNGDPDCDARPRLFSDGRAWWTDVSTKAKQRQILTDHETDFFKELQKKHNFNAEEFHIFESLKRGTNYHDGDYTGEDAVKAKNELLALADTNPEVMVRKFWDMRIFGTNLLEGEKSKGEDELDENGKKLKKPKKPKGDNGAGKKKTRFCRSGPVTISPSISIAPVLVHENTLSKRYCLRDDNLGKLQGDLAPMARKFIEHGLFAARITVNPNSAHYTGTTNDDIEVFKDTLKHIFNFTTSCSRPAGSMRIVHIWWADHDNILGSFNDFDFWTKLTPTKKSDAGLPSSSLEDYAIPTPESVGFKNVVDLA